MSDQPVWTNDWPRRARPQHNSARRWRVDYDLAYDGGGTRFTLYYRTRFGARWAAFWHEHVRSWGGTVKLYDQHATCREPERPLAHRARRRRDRRS